MEILLVEDNLADVVLTREALAEGRVLVNLTHAADGVAALELLRPGGEQTYRPDMILLDLNMPRMSGTELLDRLKADPALKHIPVVVLTTSSDEADVLASYRRHASCYIEKPVNVDRFVRVVQSLDDFWLTVVRLPSHGDAG